MCVIKELHCVTFTCWWKPDIRCDREESWRFIVSNLLIENSVYFRFCSFEGANENVWHVLVSFFFFFVVQGYKTLLFCNSCWGFFLHFWSWDQGPVEFGKKALDQQNWENWMQNNRKSLLLDWIPIKSHIFIEILILMASVSYWLNCTWIW